MSNISYIFGKDTSASNLSDSESSSEVNSSIHLPLYNQEESGTYKGVYSKLNYNLTKEVDNHMIKKSNSSDGGGGNMDTNERVAKLEVSVEHISANLNNLNIKADKISDSLNDIKIEIIKEMGKIATEISQIKTSLPSKSFLIGTVLSTLALFAAIYFFSAETMRSYTDRALDMYYQKSIQTNPSFVSTQQPISTPNPSVTPTSKLPVIK